MAQVEAVQILFELLQRFANSPHGLSTPEIADEFSITRQTAWKYVGILQAAGIPIYDQDRRWYLDTQYRIPSYWSPTEAELLKLVIDRMQQTSLVLGDTVRALVNKLAPGLQHENVSKLPANLTNKQHLFTRLVEAKQQYRTAEIIYRGLNAPAPNRWWIKPYQFVMPVWSDTVYVLCDARRQSLPRERRLALKFDRLLDVHLTDETFTPIAEAELKNALEKSWMIWLSDADPVTVRLRFAPRLYQRLLESRWHANQKILQESDGSVLWETQLADVREIVPWVRAWGSEAEVLEPPALRQIIQRDLEAALRQYQPQAVPVTSLLDLLWAKYAPKTQQYHLLLCHLLDVTAVAQVMWQSLSRAQRAWMCAQAGLDEAATMRLCSLLIGLHDIGKASPGFQKKAPPLFEQLAAQALKFDSFEVKHGIVSTLILRDSVTLALPLRLAAAIGGHHGEWVRNMEVNHNEGCQGDLKWRELQELLIDRLMAVVGISEIQIAPALASSPVAAFLAGYTSVADWIGSNEQYFPYVQSCPDPHEYFELSLERAREALLDLGWGGSAKPAFVQTFEQLFAFNANPLQEAIVNALDSQRIPHLIIVEAPTGIGKTEVALYMASWLSQALDLNGLYIAMPTQATSNQMYYRAAEFLKRRYPDEAVNYQLIHSQSDLNPLYQEVRSGGKQEGNESGLIAPEWFTHRKRTLLSPYAVGTVDQALLAVLTVRHFFVRLFGLSHRVVIFDEVHAYDTYMSTLFDRLLEWLKVLGSPVILLSATLPHATRQRLLGDAEQAMVSYPRVTFAYPDGMVQTLPLPSPARRSIQLHPMSADVSELVILLVESLQDGGCAAVVCNTVREAQHIARILAESGYFTDDELFLFHAQYPPQWRDRIEQTVVERFGKDGERPQRAVLVATQIIEQSLDLDFDLMVTSIAPIDLLIQRMGRLHRHERPRPALLETPYLVIRQPVVREGIPEWGSDGYVYEPYLLLQTWWQLRDCREILIPDDLDRLIEAVYQDSWQDDTDWSDALRQVSHAAYQKMGLQHDKDAFLASQPVIPSSEGRWLTDVGFVDDPVDDLSASVAKTRLIEPGVQIVCLHRADGQVSLEPDQIIPCDLTRKPSSDEVRAFMRYTLHVRNRALKAALEKLPVPEGWLEIRTLSLARAIIFEDGRFRVPQSRFTLRLTDTYGLEIIEEA